MAAGDSKAEPSSSAPAEPVPTYTYLPPGSSLREPILFKSTSMNEPVYFYDPAPQKPGADTLHNVSAASSSANASSSSSMTSQPATDIKSSRNSKNVTITFGGAPKPKPPKPQSPDEPAEPLYTYLPPGSSMREPLALNLDETVHFVDARPDPKFFEQDAKPGPKGAGGM